MIYVIREQLRACNMLETLTLQPSWSHTGAGTGKEGPQGMNQASRPQWWPLVSGLASHFLGHLPERSDHIGLTKSYETSTQNVIHLHNL